MRESRAKRNRQAISDYLLIVRGKAERPTAGSYLNLEAIAASSGKPDSDPPLTDRMMELLEHPDNREASRHIEPALKWLSTHNGIAHYSVLIALDNPALPSQWENRESEDDEGRLYAYNTALRLLEERIESRAPGVELHVAYQPEDRPAADKKDASNIKKRYGREQAYRKLYAEWVKAVGDGIPSEDAKILVASANDTYPTKVREAIAYMREREAV